MKTMHVLMFGLDNTMFTSENRGDLPERLKEYAKHVRHISIIIYTPDNGYHPLKIADNVTVYPTNSSSKIMYVRHALKLAHEIHENNKVDLTTGQDPFACALACNSFKRKTGVPFVVNIVSSFFDNPYWLKESKINPSLNYLGKKMILKADGVRVECETERDKCISLGVNPDKVKVAPVLVDLQRFIDCKETVRERFLQSKYDRIVLYVGRLSKEKNVGYLIDAAKIISEKRPKTRFLIVGKGDQEDALKRKAGNNPHIMFTGRVPHSEIPKYHKSADVLVLPSLYEGIPLVLVEAGASGIPVITTDTRDAHDVVVDGKTGFVVPKNNVELLANTILNVLDNPNRKQMGLQGREEVLKKFSRELNLQQCLTLWKQAVKISNT